MALFNGNSGITKTSPASNPVLLAEDAIPEETGSRRGAEGVRPFRSALGGLRFEPGILRDASEWRECSLALS
jgi:hypothetical protein